MRLLVCTFCALVLSACAFDANTDDLPLSAEGQHAYDVLRDAEMFSGDGVGFAGLMPATVEQFRVLIAEPEADAAFKTLMGEATPAGQLFGLAGVYFTDAGRFAHYADHFRRSSERVSIMQGCIMQRTSVGRVVPDIADGTFPRSIRGH